MRETDDDLRELQRIRRRRAGSHLPLASCALVVATALAGAVGARAADALDPGTAVRRECGGLAVQLGPREALLGDGALGLHYFPDQGVSTLARAPALRLLVAARFSTYLVEGPGLRTLERAKEVLRPGAPGSFDNAYAGVGGIYPEPGGPLYAFYHAEDQEGLPRFPGGLPAFYASVGVAVSRDAGESWEKLGPAVTSAMPKSWSAFEGHRGRGAGFPTAVTDPEGQHLLLFYNDLSHVGRRGVQIFLARARLGDGPPVPGAFQKYHEGAFSQPGLGGLDTPVVSALGMDESAAVQPFVVRALGRYVLFFHVQSWKEHPDLRDPPQPAGKRSGLYLATSSDGIHWSEPCKLLSDRAFPELGESISWETGVVQDADDGARGWLVYGYSPSWGPGTAGAPGPPHFMVGRRIELRLPEASAR